MKYTIGRRGSYIIITDENNKIYDCPCTNVIVKTRNVEEFIYTIIFNNQLQPQNFYDVPFLDILNEGGINFDFPQDWEKWYQLNTGEGCASEGEPIYTVISNSDQVITPGSYVATNENNTLSSINPSLNVLRSVSFMCKSGQANISLDAGVSFFSLSPGESVNINADGGIQNSINSQYNILWDTTSVPDTSLLIIYTYS